MRSARIHAPESLTREFFVVFSIFPSPSGGACLPAGRGQGEGVDESSFKDCTPYENSAGDERQCGHTCVVP